MKVRLCVWISTLVMFALPGTEVEASTTLRHSSGDAMQSYDSLMMISNDAPPWFIRYVLLPILVYPQVPSITIVNVEVNIPELEQRPTRPPRPPARPIFWSARRGVFVELDVTSTMNLMEE